MKGSPKIPKTGEFREVDYIVLGAGPAGLQLGYYLERAGRPYVILERGNGAGTFFETMPRHRLLLSINKVHTGHDDPELNLRWDWNSLLTDDEQFRLGRYSSDYFPNADRLVEYLRDFARQSKLKIRYDVSVVRVERRGDGFVLRDSHGISYRL